MIDPDCILNPKDHSDSKRPDGNYMYCPFGIWRSDPKREIITCSKELYTILGIPRKEIDLPYLSYLSYIHPEDQRMVQNTFQKSLENNWDSYELEYRIIRDSDKKICFINEKCIHEKNADKKIIGSLGIIEDISSEKEYLHTLQQNNLQFKTIFEKAADPIFIADENTGMIIEVNYAAERLLKMPKNLIVGKHQSELHPVNQGEYSTFTFRQHLEELRNNKFTLPLENQVLDADGNLIPVEILASKGIFEGKSCLVGTFRNISERKKVETELISAKEKIEESEQKFRAAFYTSPDSISINTLEGRYVEINESFTKVTGYTSEDIVGKLSTEVGIWAIPEDRTKLIDGLKRKGIVENLESVFRTKSGDLVPALMSARIIKIKNEPHILSVTREITNRKKFETELLLAKEKAEENEEKLFAFINSIPDIVCYKDPEGRWLLANEADLNLFGLNEVSYQGKTDLELAEYTHPIYKEAFALCHETDELAWKRKTISKGPEMIPTINGEVRVFDVYKIPQFLPNGERKGLAVVGRDITELYKTQEKLIVAKEIAEENEEKFKQIAENSNEIFWLRNDKEFFYINPAFEKIFGIARETAYANPQVFFEIIHPEDKPGILSIFQTDDYKLRGLFNHEYRIIRPDKEVRWILAKSNPIYSKGILIRRIGFATDITERKKAEIDLVFAKNKAEESDRLKTAFIQNMSHEIRTPMNAIMGFSELLSSNFDNKARLNRYSDIITQRCSDLLKIINDLLDIAKIESGQLTTFIESFSLPELFAELKDTFDVYQEKTRKTNISFNYKIPDAQVKTFKTDKLRLKQIFINLINNAFKFTDTGKIEFGFYLNKEKRIVFYVSDTGIGIAKDKQDEIFKRFTQISSDLKRNYGGTGLGLSIVKGLLQVLEGEIWVESEPHNGTTFHFTIDNKEQTDIKNSLEKVDNHIEIFALQNKKILIVEDDPYNSALFDEILLKFDATLLHAETGKEAIDIALQAKPDVILMDIGLPDISGYEVISEILSQRPESIIIAQTAYASKEDHSKAIGLGCVDYISKPIRVSQLMSIVEKHLST